MHSEGATQYKVFSSPKDITYHRNMETKVKPNKVLGYVLLVLAGLSFATFVEATRALDRNLDWQAAVLARGVFGCVIALPLAWFSLHKLNFFDSKMLMRTALVSIFTFGILYAASVISPSDAIAVTSTLPIWVAFLSMIFLAKRYTIAFWFACAVVVGGMVLLVAAKPTAAFFVIVLLLGATVCRGGSLLMLQTMKEVPSTILALHLSIVLAIASAIVFFFSGGFDNLEVLLDARGIALLFTIGIASNLFIILTIKVVGILGSIAGGVVGLIAAAMAYIIDILLWGDAVTMLHIFGLLLVLIPVAWIVLSKHVVKLKTM
jgi:drug/metabolite transporter (DMT)-like permease